MELINVHRERWGTVPVSFVRRESYARVIRPQTKDIEFVTPAWSPGTAGARRGRAVVLSVEDLQNESKRQTARNAWILLRTAAGIQGCGTAPVIDEVAILKSGGLGIIRASADGYLRADHHIPAACSDRTLLPHIITTQAQWQQLAALVDRGHKVDLEIAVGNQLECETVEQYNLIADLPGSDHADEFIYLSAHVDSWDAAQGALDNAAGVASVLEAARLISASGIKHARTIRLLLTTGEEQGLLGSTHYVTAHPDILPRIVALFNMDIGDDPGGLTVTSVAHERFHDVLGLVSRLDPKHDFAVRIDNTPPINNCGTATSSSATAPISCAAGGAPLQAGCATTPGPSCATAPGCVPTTQCSATKSGCGASATSASSLCTDKSCPSDHVPFAQAGVPAFGFFPRDRVNYEHHHHTQFDNFSSINAERLQHTGLVLAVLALGVDEIKSVTPEAPVVQTGRSHVPTCE